MWREENEREKSSLKRWFLWGGILSLKSFAQQTHMTTRLCVKFLNAE